MSLTDIKGTLTKAQLMETLAKQRAHLADRVRAAEVNLVTMDAAIADMEAMEFEQATVSEENGAFTFTPVVENNDE